MDGPPPRAWRARTRAHSPTRIADLHVESTGRQAELFRELALTTDNVESNGETGDLHDRPLHACVESTSSILASVGAVADPSTCVGAPK